MPKSVQSHVVCMGLASVAFLIDANAADTTTWHQKPFAIMAGDSTLDTRHVDSAGHAAPFLIDMDGDGRRDLVVGSINGEFHLYKNVGTDSSPRFGKDAGLLMADDKPARVENWCCMAVAPQFADTDKDGVPDMFVGSYGGPVYWFKGMGGTQFKLPHQLLSMQGVTVVAHPETFLRRDGNGFLRGQMDSYAANVALAAWNDDDQPDLILGNHLGELMVFSPFVQAQPGYNPPGLHNYTPVRLTQDRAIPNEILIDGQKVLPGDNRHAAPAVADWDGDGLWDLLVGSKDGEIYFLRNTGKPGAPEFKTREPLIPGGTGFQMRAAGEAPLYGIRTQIHAADYNGDGKLDLLVGAYSATVTPRVNLTPDERKKMKAIWAELEAIDKKVGNAPRELPMKTEIYSKSENRPEFQRAQALLKQLSPYLVAGEQQDYVSNMVNHGNVWVYLRNTSSP